MAQCERCGTSGHDMRDMSTDQDKKMFIGPCCVKADPSKFFDSSKINYGIEISSHMGVRAYATYGGFSVEFKKTAEEINKWIQETQSQMETPPPTQETQTEQTTVLN